MCASPESRDHCAKTVALPASNTPARWNNQNSAATEQVLIPITMPIPAFASRRSAPSPSPRAASPASRFRLAKNTTIAK